MAHRVLLTLTSHGTLGATGPATGFWLEELTGPLAVLRAAGIDTEVASITGGRPPIDPASAGGDTSDVADLDTILTSTAPIDEVDAADFDGIFLVGGHGTMWDFPGNPTLAALVSAVCRRGVVGAVCHGAAGLVDALDAGGAPLVKGRTVTAFSDAEEDAVGATAAVPFSLQQRLASLGASVEVAAPFTEHSRRDGRLVTGQNPMSSRATATLMVEALGSRLP